ncbi:helix-turn-helix domain-containing protein [Limnochorda pilosa]|uniref:helix-turn-helix domain-containing protein n=1 Tax=Limnochorda pilosa TaxID=1555112 RepID=UPI0034E95C94
MPDPKLPSQRGLARSCTELPGAQNYAPAAAEAEEAVVRVSVATSCIANSLAQPPLGLTQAQVAALVGVSQRAVGMWEEEARVVSNRSTSNANTPIDNRGDGKQNKKR